MQERPFEQPPSSNGNEVTQMSEDLKEAILKYLGTVSQAKNRDVARAIGIEKALVDKAIAELAKEDKIEYRSFGGITFIAIKGKSET
jgi:Mn-dependent DtxR family transcriptional regulator